ncbi:DEAD/DEAH box helicase [Desulfatiglans anilini]|uniref:DEAD/DEAH box helicase n=1 Tax=Desulfatiglans anilini TaxID=90728 RepID=UPI0003F86A66|nr:DEAD/DEAH box helicase [Desulfatiglans anilini]
MILFGKKSKSLLSKNYSEQGIQFSIEGKGRPVFPLNNNGPETLSALMSQGALWSALDQLWAAEMLRIGEDSWIVPYSVYDEVKEEDDFELFSILGLPEPKELEIRVSSVSHVGDPDFRIEVEAHHPEFGRLRECDYPRIGCVFFLDRERIVPLANEQRQVFDAASVDRDKLSSIDQRMAYLARTKKAALAAGAVLDDYIRNEEYEFRDQAALDVREDSPQELTLIPKIEGLDEYGYEKGENLLSETLPAVLTKVVSGKGRKRLVIDGALREKLSVLPRKGKITNSGVPRFLINPEEVVPEGIDLSSFSERVKGFKTKVYNSRPYIHVQRTTGGWLEGIPMVGFEDWSPGDPEDKSALGPSTSTGSKPEGLSEQTYKELAQRAKTDGKDFIFHEGAWIRIDAEQAERFERTLGSFSRTPEGTYRIPAGSILDIYENLELLEFVDRGSQLTGEARLLPEDLPSVDPPFGLNARLFPHQVTGYRWLARLSDYSIGGLLADDMGLGKTIQAIAHLVRLKEMGVEGPHLIILPKTLIDNWQREIEHCAGESLSVCSYMGSGRLTDARVLTKFDVVLTSYDTVRRDQVHLGTIGWNMIICDEAQYVKNPTTQRTSAIKALKSKHRAALTGTPVENGLIEFWCIMDFVQPGLLGSWSSFRENYEKPIVEGQAKEKDRIIEKLLGEIKGYYLRRLKSEILKDLPPKEIIIEEVGLSGDQLDRYRDIARKAKTGGRGAALGAIQHLLMISAHPLGLGERWNGPKELMEIGCEKLSRTIQRLRGIKERKEKAIIFTDYKHLQRILQEAIKWEFNLWPDIINGDIKQHRQIIVDIFSEKKDFNVLILSHRVAGVGLNITAANHVIHYTRPWNPAKENQATDRVHRIGQEKNVYVYYPIVKNDRFVTVEDRLNDLLSSKENLAREVLRPSSEARVNPEELLDCIYI